MAGAGEFWRRAFAYVSHHLWSAGTSAALRAPTRHDRRERPVRRCLSARTVGTWDARRLVCLAPDIGTLPARCASCRPFVVALRLARALLPARAATSRAHAPGREYHSGRRRPSIWPERIRFRVCRRGKFDGWLQLSPVCTRPELGARTGMTRSPASRCRDGQAMEFAPGRHSPLPRKSAMRPLSGNRHLGAAMRIRQAWFSTARVMSGACARPRPQSACKVRVTVCVSLSRRRGSRCAALQISARSGQRCICCTGIALSARLKKGVVACLARQCLRPSLDIAA